MKKRLPTHALFLKMFCVLFITSFICYSSASAQKTVTDYLEFGDVIYDPADSTQHGPVTIQDLILDFPEHDSLYFRLANLNDCRKKTCDCWTECYTDKLGKCFRVFMRYPEYRSAFAILDCYYYYHGEKSFMPDLYLIMDDKMRLRKWKK